MRTTEYTEHTEGERAGKSAGCVPSKFCRVSGFVELRFGRSCQEEKKRLDRSFEAGGFAACSRWLSAATPPEKTPHQRRASWRDASRVTTGKRRWHPCRDARSSFASGSGGVAALNHRLQALIPAGMTRGVPRSQVPPSSFPQASGSGGVAALNHRLQAPIPAGMTGGAPHSQVPSSPFLQAVTRDSATTESPQKSLFIRVHLRLSAVQFLPLFP